MEIEKIKGNLCSYDPRNPYYDSLDSDDMLESNPGKCYCDNCYYGRHELAEYLLEILGKDTK